jgi:prephenate dehydrogenase (NADP+)
MTTLPMNLSSPVTGISARRRLPTDPVSEQPCIGLIGMGDMGGMYARHLSAAGFKK